MDPQNRARFQIYKSRRFSNHFHHLLLECCLVSDTNRRLVCAVLIVLLARNFNPVFFSPRYSAKSLLAHRFFRQIKKSSNLLSLLPNKTSLLDQTSADDSAPSRQVETRGDLCPARCLVCEHCKYSGFIDSQFIRSDQPSDGDRALVNWKF